MRVVIASDKFKGSATGAEVAASLGDGIRSVIPDALIETVPVADGGEGTVEAAIASGFEAVTARVAGPTGAPLEARFAVRGAEAIIEMAAASGLDVLPRGEKAALTATSHGTGDLISAALDRGCTTIVLGVGGSACTDGGAGMLQALGVSLRAAGRPVRAGGAALAELADVDVSGLDPRLADATIVLASDVDNPLLGDRGAAVVFAPQKGASADDVAALEAGLRRFSELLEKQPGVRPSATAPGAGAAGGVGYAALAVLGARREPGIDVIQRLTGLADRISGADLVITGEGSLDEQSLGGKTPMGVAAAARAAGIPVIAVCGRSAITEEQATDAGFRRVYALSEIEPDPAASMANAVSLLVDLGGRLALDLVLDRASN
ncbi:Glycerate 2-kinase [Microbacterium hydrocarbonoxydans]|uniref:Glycerate 2-kinase n=1 Tax=Microbacterium hydrocarbonoxydans TaxID=273678 RepID=A0A0M2HTM0_9MICO|nr:glycerate kinase [Microbacterium hydrocarbonoxydans]KJL47834.1 Glycerate 2-kinase [Microbacterium hydrocarbonoxydans]